MSVTVNFISILQTMRITLFFLCFLLLSCNAPSNDGLLIATAANMQFAIKPLMEQFTQETGIPCKSVLSSSGKLTAQIQEGAPFDVFVSADMMYPMALYQSGFALQEPSIYAYGTLVLWTIHNDLQPAIDALSHDKIKYIALANPKTAPYGVAALEVLERFKISEIVKERLVYGENIAQTNQFITTQAADVGFTSKSVVLSPNLAQQGHWIEVPQDAYTPLAQGIVLLKNAEKKPIKAQKFYDFVFSPKGKEILTTFGYRTIHD